MLGLTANTDVVNPVESSVTDYTISFVKSTSVLLPFILIVAYVCPYAGILSFLL